MQKKDCSSIIIILDRARWIYNCSIIFFSSGYFSSLFIEKTII